MSTQQNKIYYVYRNYGSGKQAWNAPRLLKEIGRDRGAQTTILIPSDETADGFVTESNNRVQIKFNDDDGVHTVTVVIMSRRMVTLERGDRVTNEYGNQLVIGKAERDPSNAIYEVWVMRLADKHDASKKGNDFRAELGIPAVQIGDAIYEEVYLDELTIDAIAPSYVVLNIVAGSSFSAGDYVIDADGRQWIVIGVAEGMVKIIRVADKYDADADATAIRAIAGLPAVSIGDTINLTVSVEELRLLEI